MLAFLKPHKNSVCKIKCLLFYRQIYSLKNSVKYYDVIDFSDDDIAQSAEVLLTKTKHHKGSIYCASWNGTGNLLATGSNDKTVHVMRVDVDDVTSIGIRTIPLSNLDPDI